MSIATLGKCLAPVVLCGVSAWATAADLSREVSFDIPAQPLAQALADFSRQADTNVAATTEMTSGKISSAVRETTTAIKALRILLEGTQLGYRVQGSAIVVETPKAVAQASGGRISQAAPDNAPAQAEGPKSQESAEEAPKLEEVVVTAQRRQERLQDVPIAISVLSGDALDRSSTTGITETLNRVPGVAASEFSAQGGGTSLSVRGVSAAAPLFSGSSPIAYYLDSAPFGLVKQAVVPDANAFDLERVEVLRGPQGTLYGASALNGVVRVLTKDADLQKFELKARGSLATTTYGGESYRGDLALNVPVVTDKLAARAVVGYEDRSGWIDKPNRSDANDAKPLTLRLKVNAQPSDELSVAASVWLSRNDQGAPNAGFDPKRTATLLDEGIATDYDVYGLKAQYSFPAFALTSNTSYLKYSNDSHLDLSALEIGGLKTLLKADTFAEELNLTSTHAADWRWSMGGIFRTGRDVLFQYLPVVFATPLDETYRSESFAAFGEVTRLLAGGRLELTGGLRYFEDRLRQVEDSNYFGTPLGLYARPKFDNVAPRAVLSWHPSRDLTVYGSYAEGFRSGSAQEPTVLASVPSFAPVKPDKLKNYEVGAKGTFAQGRVNFDGAVFYTDWRDLQQPLSVDVGGTPFAAVVNAGSASGMGFEGAATASPVKALTLGVSYSWNDLSTNEAVFSAGKLFFAKGERLDFSPKDTAAAFVEYGFPLGEQGYTGRFTASVNHTAMQRSRLLIGSLIVAEGDALTTSRASFSVEAPRRWTATLFADNLTNEDGAVLNSYAGMPNRSLRIRPRTLGIQFEFKY